jgi:tetratricopeptide (TPR) repeat protein
VCPRRLVLVWCEPLARPTIIPYRQAWFVVSLALVASGCGPRGPVSRVPEPEAPLSTSELASARRHYFTLRPDDPEREPLRLRILATLSTRTTEVVASGDPDAIEAHLLSMTELFAPKELAASSLPKLLGPAAAGLLDRAERRGDEGLVLAAAFLLERTSDDGSKYRELYDRVAQWGREARSGVPSAFERLTQLIEVWDKHANLTPAPNVLDTLADLHVARRDAVLAGLHGQGATFPARVVGLAPLEVAGVYLRTGDVERARERVVAMGEPATSTQPFVDALSRAGGTDAAAAEALAELGEFYRSARPEVTIGICRRGLANIPTDARFPTCLARAAADRGAYLESTAFYADALRVAPGIRAIYDEAIAQLNPFIERGVFEPDPAVSRQLVAHAERIVEARQAHFPKDPSPVPEDRFQFVVAMLEMNGGNPDEAIRRFEASLAAGESPSALVQLGLLLLRLARPNEAIERFHRALELTPAVHPASLAGRAEVLAHIATAHLVAGRLEQADRINREALDTWTRAEPAFMGDRAGLVALHRGILLDRLGKHEEAKDAFDKALTLAGANRSTYATLLSHLATGMPDLELADATFRRAMHHLTLEPEWKVYFALWVELVAVRAGLETPSSVRFTLEPLSEGPSWSARLSRFALGHFTSAELIRSAKNKAETAEAHFYVAVQALRDGDGGRFRAHLESVLETRMVAFFEYEMAMKLLSEHTRDD